MKKTFGLTGGIASGKSTIAKMFRDHHGAALVDADQLAREIVAPGTPGLNAVVDAFGDQILQPDGSLDRAKLGEIVFSDRSQLKILESITHPRIAVAAMTRIAQLQDTDAPYVLYEAALLVENGLHSMFAKTIVVAVDEATQIARMKSRDGLSDDECHERLDAQLPLADKLAVADFVIENDGTLDEARVRVSEVHESLLTLANDDGDDARSEP